MQGPPPGPLLSSPGRRAGERKTRNHQLYQQRKDGQTLETPSLPRLHTRQDARPEAQGRGQAGVRFLPKRGAARASLSLGWTSPQIPGPGRSRGRKKAVPEVGQLEPVTLLPFLPPEVPPPSRQGPRLTTACKGDGRGSRNLMTSCHPGTFPAVRISFHRACFPPSPSRRISSGWGFWDVQAASPVEVSAQALGGACPLTRQAVGVPSHSRLERPAGRGQFSGIKHIYLVVQSVPPSGSRTFSPSQTETLPA